MMTIAGRAFLVGASGGIWIAASLTLARRLTWHPYQPLHLPYDMALCAGGVACLFLLLAAVLARRSERVWCAAASAVPLLLTAYLALEPGILEAQWSAIWFASGVVALDFDTKKWSELADVSSTLVFYDYPKNSELLLIED